MYGFVLPYTEAELVDACKAVVRKNGLRNAYIRPIAFLGECGMSVTPAAADMQIDVAIGRVSLGRLSGRGGEAQGRRRLRVELGADGAQYGAHRRQGGGQLLSSYLIGREARVRGFVEGIGLATDGRLSEGAGENLFLVKGGRILTPPAASSILVGITRDTVMRLAADEGIEVMEQVLPREALYTADEVFLTGTAAEITPVRSVDGIATRANGPGPVTRALQARFDALFDGGPHAHGDWLEPIAAVKAQIEEIQKDAVLESA